MEGASLNLILKNESHKFPLSTNVISKMSEDVVQKSWKYHQYIIQSEATYDDVENFIHFLLTDKMPDSVTEGFISLSSEILAKVNDSLIKQLKDINIKDKSNIEQELSQNLDHILLIDGENLLACPIQSLRTIFSNANLKNHELAYHLIVSYFEKTNDINIFVLLDYLNISKLQKESINECISKRKERLNFMPNFSPSFFEDIENNQNNINKKFDVHKHENKVQLDAILEMMSKFENIISQQKEIIESQNVQIEDQKKRLNDIENENQIKLKEIMERTEKLEKIVFEQKQIIESQNTKITGLEKEIKTSNNNSQSNYQNISQKLEQIQSKTNEQQLKCGTKLSISGNQVNLTNDGGKILSTISIPSIIEKFNFGANSGYLQLTNHLLIQWGRYIPSSWYGDGILINFPIQFKSTPFMAVTGGAGADFHPCAEGVNNKSFRTGYDHQTPTSWIAIGII